MRVATLRIIALACATIVAQTARGRARHLPWVLTPSGSPGQSIPNQQFSILVPAPGALSFFGFNILLLAQRRRRR